MSRRMHNKTVFFLLYYRRDQKILYIFILIFLSGGRTLNGYSIAHDTDFSCKPVDSFVRHLRCNDLSGQVFSYNYTLTSSMCTASQNEYYFNRIY